MRHRRQDTTPAPEQPVRVGAAVAGHRVERIIAQRAGVYTLVEAGSGDGRRVALKLFAGATGDDAQVRPAIRRLGGLRTVIEPPLLPVLGAGESGGRPYLVHAVPRGEPLVDVVRERPLAPDEAMKLLGQVAGGLETLGVLGLPYGELSPRTIFVVRRSAQALLTDYGIALAAARACETVGAVENADYVSPEQVTGNPPTPRSIVYLLACVLVECLTGAPPYPYDRPVLTLHAHLVEPAPRVSQRREGLPPALDDVIATGMNKQPAQRYASPARLMQAAQRALDVKAPIPIASPPRQRKPVREAAPAPTPAPPPRTRPQRRRRLMPWPAPAAVGLALALITSTAGFAAGNLGGGPEPAPSSIPSRQRIALVQRAEYVHAVDSAVERLSARRAVARRALRGARLPRRLAAPASALADAYADARSVLAAKPRPSTGGAPVLPARLAGAERAYRQLAVAASRRDARAFRVLRREVLRREREVERALRRV